MPRSVVVTELINYLKILFANNIVLGRCGLSILWYGNKVCPL